MARVDGEVLGAEAEAASRSASAEARGAHHRRPVVGLLRACHPGPTVAVTLLMTALAVAAGQHPAGCLLVAGAVLAGQLSVGWSNDAVDADRDIAAGRRTKPVVAGSVSAGVVRGAALTALAACAALSLAVGPLAAAVHLAGVAGAWAYNLRLKSTVLSWLPYAAGFAALPAFVSLGLPGQPWPAWWIALAAALLGVGAHLANVLPDIDADLALGVRGWPQRLGATRTRLLLPAPLVAATALLVLAAPGPPGTTGALALAAVAAVAVCGALLGRRTPKLPFAAAIVIAAADVALLLHRGAALS
ncbi:UbiA family prenyltransferase [Streptomyces hypolithicus]